MDSTSDEKKIEIPRSLGITIWDILKEKHGIEPRKNKMGLMDFSFTETELSLITKLNIKDPVAGALEGISKLINLKTLNISRSGRSITSISEFTASKNIASISDTDIREVGEVSSLKNLHINNQANISYVSLQNLRNLEYISLTNNLNLEEVEGIDQLNNLSELSCYGNKTLFSMPGLSDCIKKCKELSDVNLDVLLFPDAINYNFRTGGHDKEALDKIKSLADYQGVKWHESIVGLKWQDTITINNNQMLKLHNKSCEILAENVEENAINRDTIMGIEMYLAQNVKYDHEGLKSNLNMHSSNDGMAIGPVGGTNGAYNAIMYNSCVCEGYTRAMQYLLKLRGIKSRNVYCISGKDNINMADSKSENKYTTYKLPDNGYHSVICIEDEYCLYDDPTWNAARYQAGDKSMPWVLRTKEEISRDHTLSFAERNINNNHLNVPKNAISESLLRNDLFKKSRLSSVQQTRSTIGKDYHKGQIIKEKAR